jgi:hypothetical protein
MEVCFDEVIVTDNSGEKQVGYTMYPPQALCACARKLILIAWAVVAKHQLFDPEYEKSPLLTLSIP